MNKLHQIVVIGFRNDTITKRAVKRILRAHGIEVLLFFREPSGALVGHIRFDPNIVSRERILRHIEPQVSFAGIIPVEEEECVLCV